MTPDPLDYWQTLLAPCAFRPGPQADGASYVAALPDGRGILLPIRTLPDGSGRGVASLIVAQASFAVLDALLDALAPQVEADVIVGVPTLGLPVAEGLARRLGHARYAALGTSRKFWYDEAFSEPMASITSPGAGKRLWLDPRLLPLLAGRVLLVDDVISTGASTQAALRLLARAGVAPAGLAYAMAQGEAGRSVRPDVPMATAIATPLLERVGAGWRALG